MRRLDYTLVALFALSLSVAQVQAAKPKAFTDAELEQLNQGARVARDTVQRRGDLKLIGGQSWQVIDLPPDSVWLAIKDVAHYRNMLPGRPAVNIVRSKRYEKLLELVHSKGPIKVSYHLNMKFDDATQTMKFRLDETRPNDMRAGWGYIRVRSWNEGQSLVSWGALVDIGEGILVGIIRPTVQKWLLRVPSKIKKWSEGKGLELYAQGPKEAK